MHPLLAMPLLVCHNYLILNKIGPQRLSTELTLNTLKIHLNCWIEIDFDLQANEQAHVTFVSTSPSVWLKNSTFVQSLLSSSIYSCITTNYLITPIADSTNSLVTSTYLSMSFFFLHSNKHTKKQMKKQKKIISVNDCISYILNEYTTHKKLVTPHFVAPSSSSFFLSVSQTTQNSIVIIFDFN